MPDHIERTDWISAEVEPVHIGWYERDRGVPLILKDYWDGKRWTLGDANGGRYPMFDAGWFPWRGLAQPSGSAD
jgi:hypothetical protein